jgi:hypothetical protein
LRCADSLEVWFLKHVVIVAASHPGYEPC